VFSAEPPPKKTGLETHAVAEGAPGSTLFAEMQYHSLPHLYSAASGCIWYRVSSFTCCRRRALEPFRRCQDIGHGRRVRGTRQKRQKRPKASSGGPFCAYVAYVARVADRLPRCDRGRRIVEQLKITAHFRPHSKIANQTSTGAPPVGRLSDLALPVLAKVDSASSMSAFVRCRLNTSRISVRVTPVEPA
jgi:hypothetical protein